MATLLGKPFSKSDISNLENGRSQTVRRIAVYAAFFGLEIETVIVTKTAQN